MRPKPSPTGFFLPYCYESLLVSLAILAEQVRERMRMSKEALQKLGPIAAAIAPAAAIVKPAAAMKPLEDDDDACIICLDQLSTVVFSPCNHRVTCGACAKLVLKAKQPCPLCRGPVVSVRR